MLNTLLITSTIRIACALTEVSGTAQRCSKSNLYERFLVWEEGSHLMRQNKWYLSLYRAVHDDEACEETASQSHFHSHSLLA